MGVRPIIVGILLLFLFSCSSNKVQYNCNDSIFKDGIGWSMELDQADFSKVTSVGIIRTSVDDEFNGLRYIYEYFTGDGFSYDESKLFKVQLYDTCSLKIRYFKYLN